MNAPSPWLRPLQLIAVLLGIAIVVLFAARQRVAPPLADVANAAHASSPPMAATPVAAAVSAPNVVVPAAATDRVRESTLTTDARAMLYGSVRSADGLPVTNGVLWLYRGDEHVGTQSLGDGTFVFVGLTAGEHRLDSRFDDQLRVRRTVTVEAPRTRLDWQLAACWSLTVNAVTPDGTPLVAAIGKQMKSPFWTRNLTAFAFAEPLPGDLLPSNFGAFEAGLGRFRGNDPMRSRGEKALPKQTIGVLTLPSDRPVHVALMLRNVLLAQAAVPVGQPEFTFTLSVDALLAKTAKVRLRLVDESGAPVAGARAGLSDMQTGGVGMPCDADGRIAFTGVVPGRLDLDVSHSSLCAPPLHIDVTAGADLDLGDVTLRPGVGVELDFSNFGGKGGVRGYWLDAPASPGRSVNELHWSAENGSPWRVRLFPGRHGLLATGASGVAFVEIDTRSLSGQPIRFDLQPAAALRLVYRAEAGSVYLTVRKPQGAIVAQRELRGSNEYAMKLPPGEYEVEMGDGMAPPTRRPLRLGPDGATLTIP
jgi:hypothetical protein